MFRRIAAWPALLSGALVLSALFVTPAAANHSWGGYHWARKANPFTLQLIRSVTSAWTTTLETTRVDWSGSSVLDLTSVAGDTAAKTRKQCPAVSGKVRV